MSEENIPQMRETIERLSKDNAGLESNVVDLTGQLRVRDARDAFRTEGFVPRNGDLFAAMNPEGDITAEAVVAFAEEQGLPLAGVESVPEDAGDSKEDGDESESLSGMSGGGSRAGDGGASGAASESLTRQEWQQLYADDPDAARRAIASGSVQISDNGPAPKGTNPYATLTQTST
jgi:hypothetical protein